MLYYSEKMREAVAFRTTDLSVSELQFESKVVKGLKVTQGWLLIVAALFSAPLFSASEVYYVFKDKNGNSVIQDSIPAAYVNQGYRMINEQGLTIRTVSSVSEQRRLADAAKKRRSDAKGREKQRKEDDMLMASFSSIDQIREAGNKKILSIQGQIDITLSHIKAFEKNLADLQVQAIEFAKRPGGITQAEVDEVQSVKTSIVRNREFIVRQRDEQHKLRQEYMVYIDRFKSLTSH